LDALKQLPSPPAAVLEIGYDFESNAVPEKIQRSFAMLA